jgi:tungstate transport system substrate-binding protein
MPRSPRPRRLGVACLAAVAALAVWPAAGRADDAATVTVVGTSDVSDSNLVSAVLKPGFEAAYPQYHLNYVSQGTGAAIATAKAGAASGLLVHAASLENQFVADGYSNEPYGRAIFYGDYVLLGPASDPAGVLANAPHDIVTAFERIAAAGQAGNANFVSRGGTPGTTVEEHLIWAKTTGVTLCDVSAANGGGSSPSTATGACPATISYPSWYHATGLTQGPNIVNADACNYPGGNCYVLTDRGTFNFLQSTGAAQNLHIVTRDNSAAARGGATFLVNTFHAYVLNPARFAGNTNVQINVAGATAFLNWVTSPAGQAAVAGFLGDTHDPPFLPSASPRLTAAGLPATIDADQPVTVSGHLQNVVPGTPALGGVTVTLATPAGPVATGTTDAGGNYSLAFSPVANASYTVSTGQITKIEDATLNPQFGDLLAPATAAVGSMTVQSAIAVSKVSTRYRRAVVTGTVAPATHAHGVVTVTATKGSRTVNAGTATVTGGTFSVIAKLAPGTYRLQARLDDPGQVVSSLAAPRTVKVPGAATVRVSHLRVHGRHVTVTGSVTPAPASSGGYVRLLGRFGKHEAAPIGARVKLAKGKRTFAFTRRVRAHRWHFQVEYVHKGAIDTAKSKARSARVR